jgi:hypothetical protein
MTLDRGHIVGEEVKALGGMVDGQHKESVEAVLPENHETVMFGVIGLFTWASVSQERGKKGNILFHNTSQSSS